MIGEGSYPGDLFVVPLTSQIANADYALADWKAAGLNVPSGVKAQRARTISRSRAPLRAHDIDAHGVSELSEE